MALKRATSIPDIKAEALIKKKKKKKARSICINWGPQCCKGMGTTNWLMEGDLAMVFSYLANCLIGS